jgi:hypothetical protein
LFSRSFKFSAVYKEKSEHHEASHGRTRIFVLRLKTTPDRRRWSVVTASMPREQLTRKERDQHDGDRRQNDEMSRMTKTVGGVAEIGGAHVSA